MPAGFSCRACVRKLSAASCFDINLFPDHSRTKRPVTDKCTTWCAAPDSIPTTHLKSAAEPLDLLLELLDFLLPGLLLALQASLGSMTPLEVLVQAVHFLLQAGLLAFGCLGRLLRSLKLFIKFLHAHLCRSGIVQLK